jgi:hypothetical protein
MNHMSGIGLVLKVVIYRYEFKGNNKKKCSHFLQNTQQSEYPSIGTYY